MTILRRGITLIEILVSLGLGMVLVAIGTSALLHVSKVFTRNTAHLQGHDDAAAISQRLISTLESVYHPAQMRFSVTPGADAAWGSGDEYIELTWMSSVRSLDEGTMGYAPRPMHDLIWQRMVWQGDGQGGGTVSFASSSGKRTIPAWTFTNGGVSYTPNITIGPFVRRDRRRDLDDNDLRYVPGMDMPTYLGVGAKGDSQDLNDRLYPWHPPTTRIASCVIEAVDAAGDTIHCDAITGVTIRSPLGAVAPLGTSYSNTTTQVLDGTWLDGRTHVPSDVPNSAPLYHRQSTSSQRPLLLRFRFELVMGTDGDRIRNDKDPRLPFTLTIAPGMSLPPL